MGKRPNKLCQEIAPYSEREAYLKFVPEGNATSPFVEGERITIKFALARVVRLSSSPIPEVTGKPSHFTCGSRWKFDGDVKADDGIDQAAIASKCSFQLADTDMGNGRETINQTDLSLDILHKELSRRRKEMG